jgi:hypothetical protein
MIAAIIASAIFILLLTEWEIGLRVTDYWHVTATAVEGKMPTFSWNNTTN